MGKVIPKPSILDSFKVLGVRGNTKIWQDENGRLYTWDSLHGEVEVFNKRGFHLGAVDPIYGRFIKAAVEGRRLDV